MSGMDSLVAQFCLVFGCSASTGVTIDSLKDEATPTPKVVQSAQARLGRYRSLLIEISDNPSREAALTAQESNWNPMAKSPYAKGLRQFTDKTGRWAARSICRHLGSYQPYNPEWSLRCGVVYIEHLMKNNKYKGGDYCFNRKVAEQEYNGGSWVIRELRRTRSWTLREARTKCRRASWACKENYEYPIRISKKQPKYATMGGILCK